MAAECTRRLIRQRKVFGSTLARTLDDLKTRRHQADYSTVTMSDKIAQRVLARATTFVEAITVALAAQGGH